MAGLDHPVIDTDVHVNDYAAVLRKPGLERTKRGLRVSAAWVPVHCFFIHHPAWWR
ncbi:hypothetical protein [Variovorax sp. OV700]|uniref:hypothetical protein n=1 Tax=Variovorax sp. OV700 TaxID=1882826 RepID=UPI000ABD1C70|nr:hypothetical protein [Variovorax sp. OV700]